MSIVHTIIHGADDRVDLVRDGMLVLADVPLREAFDHIRGVRAVSIRDDVSLTVDSSDFPIIINRGDAILALLQHVPGLTDAEHVAYARLFAAAPAMFAALRAVSSACDMNDEDHEDFADSAADVAQELSGADPRGLLQEIESALGMAFAAALPTRTVYPVFCETNSGRADESDGYIVNIFATRELADAARLKEMDAAIQRGDTLHFDEREMEDGEGNEHWDANYEVQELPVLTTVPEVSE